MATSPSHKYGQIIGNILEKITDSLLQKICEEANLYLDKQGDRVARAGKKVTWYDIYGNKHDLDFVVEKNGTANKMGEPVAFIESAWRRYTKHSKNKAQEIQGAVLPIAEKYRHNSPFLGVVLAGDFTKPSLTQLKSVGFHILYFSYKSVVQAFDEVGIDAEFDEDTETTVLQGMVDKIENLSVKDLQKVEEKLLSLHADRVKAFKDAFTDFVGRVVERIIVVPRYGQDFCFENTKDAQNFCDEYDAESQKMSDLQLRDFYVCVHYSNGDKIEANFKTINKVKSFLLNV